MLIQLAKGANFKVSDHFTISEFQCPCANCNLTMISAELVTLLEHLRTQINEPLKITSGYRCPAHNKFIGGALNSFHPQGLAVDFRTVSGNKLELLYSFCLKHRTEYEEIRALEPTRSPIGIGGLGRYEDKSGNLSRIHLDLRTTKTLVTWTKPA